ncbi:alpha/beta hydrolase [Streptomyces sp. NPDC018693]|uniref:alpha/beta hydrolase n=1 Tax=unclassified Streptomyces TaxID=2593676 RepID=UPI0037B5B858
MPIGYLVAMALVTWCTFFAAVAPRRPGLPATLSFRFGLAASELPFLGMYWIAASTSLALAQGDLASPGGLAGLAMAAASLAGLVVVTQRGARARRVLAEALHDGLGADWRSALDPATAAGLRRRPPLARILLRPFLVRRRDVERIPDIPYGDAGRYHLLDVYRHRSHPEGAPVLIHFHGGGYRSGRKDREARPLLYRLAGQGWTCVSANYRLKPDGRFPDPLVDAKRVIAWVREQGLAHGADPSVLFLAGCSAGGHLACTAALTANDPAFQPGFEQADTSVTAVISLSGYYGSAVAEEPPPSTPAAYLRPDTPPVLLVHGDKDALVPVENARAFATALRDTSTAPVVYAELPGAQHSFDLFHSLRFEAVVDAAESFAAWVRATRKSQEPRGTAAGTPTMPTRNPEPPR